MLIFLNQPTSRRFLASFHTWICLISSFNPTRRKYVSPTEILKGLRFDFETVLLKRASIDSQVFFNIRVTDGPRGSIMMYRSDPTGVPNEHEMSSDEDTIAFQCHPCTTGTCTFRSGPVFDLPIVFGLVYRRMRRSKTPAAINTIVVRNETCTCHVLCASQTATRLAGRRGRGWRY